MRWFHVVIMVAVVTLTVLATNALYKKYVSKTLCNCGTTSGVIDKADLAIVRDIGTGMGGKKSF